jgi:hypothetical protein
MTNDGTVAVSLVSTPGGKAMGSLYSGNNWSDEQLDAIMFEPATWTVNGLNGQALGTVPNLRRALDRAASLAASGVVITALRRIQGVVFEAQTVRLRKLCAGRETPVFRESQRSYRPSWKNSRMAGRGQ